MRIPASMKTTAALFALLCLMASGDATTPLTLVAQETDSQETTDETAPPKTRRKPRGRVPNHYGKIGLTDAQKEEIYAIQAKYRGQVEKLQEQINELQQEEASEIYLVLTDNQKDALKKILADVAERRKKD